MILTVAVLAGVLAGLARGWFMRRPFQAPHLHFTWLVALAFLPQWLAFDFPATRTTLPDAVASLGLLISQALLLVFAWHNRQQPGMKALGVGVALNLMVIAINGGFMPISPDSVTWLAFGETESWSVGNRLWSGKDIVLPVEATHLWWLSDRFLTPDWFPYRVAYSLGDVLIAIGAFWLLWSIGSDRPDERTSPTPEGAKAPVETGSAGI